MRLLPTAATMLFAAATLATTVSLSYAQTCQSLWVERNSYYKAAGYCFHTCLSTSCKSSKSMVSFGVANGDTSTPCTSSTGRNSFESSPDLGQNVAPSPGALPEQRTGA
jgi:hypothetical protein